MTGQPLSPLRELVYDDTRQTERECQSYLAEIANALCLETYRDVVMSGREEANRFGESDFTVSARIMVSRNSFKITAYVWEVKAPQCFLYEFDDNRNRLRPTKELIKAENQLLHYASDFNDMRAFRSRYGLDAYSKVVPAGILIGRDDRLVRPNRNFQVSAADTRALFDQTSRIRDLYLYDLAGIRIRTWDWAIEEHEAKLWSLANPGGVQRP